MSKITRRSFFQKAGAVTASGITSPGLASTSLQAETTPNWITMPDWPDLTKEPALEPELPIIDPLSLIHI